MPQKSIIIFSAFIIASLFASGQQENDALNQLDSVWSVMIIKNNESPEMRDNMATYSPNGFFLYKNCFYDLKLSDGQQKTLRLVDIKKDTLVFIGISLKKDDGKQIVSKDTSIVGYQNIERIILVKKWKNNKGKQIKCSKHTFIFFKSEIDNRLASRNKKIFPDIDSSEIIPRLSATGITYHAEFNGRLLYMGGIPVNVPKYSDEQKRKTLKFATTVLDIIINKRISITIENK